MISKIFWFLADEQVNCPEPVANTGVIIEDATPDIVDYTYGSKIKYKYMIINELMI